MSLTTLQEVIKMLVNERISHQIDLNHLASLNKLGEVILYIDSLGLPHVGSGSSRDVYAIDSKRVIKIANSNDAIIQNKKEWLVYNATKSENLVAEIYLHSEHFYWLICESINNFKSEKEMRMFTGIDENLLTSFLYELDRSNAKQSSDFSYEKWLLNLKEIWKEKSKKLPIFSRHINTLDNINDYGHELLSKLCILYIKHDVDDIARYEHWGLTSSQNIVCIDSGYNY